MQQLGERTGWILNPSRERELLGRVVGFYERTLKESGDALGYLERRGSYASNSKQPKTSPTTKKPPSNTSSKASS